jgi:integrase
MSLLFNHGVRHGICETNPIRLVRQGAKRKTIPLVLTPDEVRRLIEALPLREKTLVLLAAGTGLRMSELFALKWGDVHFDRNEVSVIRSIVMQSSGHAKQRHHSGPFRWTINWRKPRKFGASNHPTAHRTIGSSRV